MPSDKPHAQRARERYRDDAEYRERTREYQAAYRRRRYKDDPEFREKVRANSARHLDGGDNRATNRVRKRAAHLARCASDPQYAARYRKYRRDYARRRYARDPAYREKQRQANLRYRERQRKAAAAKPAP